MRTLEEVKKHFEGVEIAKCVASKKEFNFADADIRGIHYDHDAYWIVVPNCSSFMIYHPNGDEFAEIVSKPRTHEVFKGSELQYKSSMDNEWQKFPENWDIRFKPDYSKEIAELERQIEELKNK